MRMYGLKSIETGKFEVREDNETLTVPAVITREDVYDYDGMLVYEPAEEIEEATLTAQNAWVVENHPVEVILTKAEDIRGRVASAIFEEDRIKADLTFFKSRCSPQYLADIKKGRIKSVSIGFFWEPQPKKGEFNGKHYDYVMRNIFIDHVAVGSWTGRCSYPLCGIGIDGKLKEANPYPNEHSCRLRNPETLDIVGSGERKHNGKTYRVIFGKPKGKPEAGSVEQAYRYPVETWSEAQARKHCQDHEGSFEPASKEEGDTVKEKNQGEESEREKLHATAEEREKKYGITVRYNPELPEAKALSESVKKQLEGYESADSLIAKVNALVKQLKITA